MFVVKMKGFNFYIGKCSVTGCTQLVSLKANATHFCSAAEALSIAYGYEPTFKFIVEEVV